MSVIVNGVNYPVPDHAGGRRLLDFVRDDLGLTGTKEGCGEGDCGACTVLVDAQPVCSCLTLLGTLAGRSVVTVEGLPPLQARSFATACETGGGVQCGFCTPGIAVMAAWIAAGGTETGTEPLAKLLEGNLCRCTGYLQLLDAIEVPG